MSHHTDPTRRGGAALSPCPSIWFGSKPDSRHSRPDRTLRVEWRRETPHLQEDGVWRRYITAPARRTRTYKPVYTQVLGAGTPGEKAISISNNFNSRALPPPRTLRAHLRESACGTFALESVTSPRPPRRLGLLYLRCEQDPPLNGP